MTPKDITTKRGEALFQQQIYRHANFHADRWHLRRDICPRTHTYTERITADEAYDKMHTSITFVV